ncbi:MAG: hypothetical protein ACLFS6_07730 [Methanomassiliicoccales archaeon]
MPRLGGARGGLSFDLSEWGMGRDLPTDPDTGRPVSAWVNLIHDRYRSANASVEMTIEGWQDDGTVWIMRQLEGERDLFQITFHLFSPGRSTKVAAHPVVYIGEGAPTSELQFTALGNANRGEGWLPFQIEGPGGQDPWVAVGSLWPGRPGWDTSWTMSW